MQTKYPRRSRVKSIQYLIYALCLLFLQSPSLLSSCLMYLYWVMARSLLASHVLCFTKIHSLLCFTGWMLTENYVVWTLNCQKDSSRLQATGTNLSPVNLSERFLWGYLQESRTIGTFSRLTNPVAICTKDVIDSEKFTRASETEP